MLKQEDYKKIFIQEAEELLQLLNNGLLVLEKNNDDYEALNSIFRAAHTMKSMSASMGFMQMSELTHKMEDVLSEVRGGKLRMSSEIVDLLFESFDSLDRMMTDIHESRITNEKIDGLKEKMDRFLDRPSAPPEDRVTEKLSLNLFDKSALAKAKKEGFSSYFLTIKLDPNCVLKSVRVFMVFRNLHVIGEVIKSVPNSQLIEEEKFGLEFGCVFVSSQGEDVIRNKVEEVLEIDSVDIERIEVSDSWDADISSDKVFEKSEIVRKIQSVRVDVNRLDKMMNLVEELAITKLHLFDVCVKFEDQGMKTVLDGMNRIVDELQTEVMQARLVPVSQIFDRFPRLVRDLSKKEGKKVKLSMTGGDIELDRSVLDEIGDALIHLLRNALDHGLESSIERKNNGKPEESVITLSARREKTHVYIEVEDDGRGMNIAEIKRVALERKIVTEEALRTMNDDEVLLLTATPGFSTKSTVTNLSGRGVGLDVAKETVEGLGGSLLMRSTIGKGTLVTLRLPITTAVVKALLVGMMDRIFAIPTTSIVEIVVKAEHDIKRIENQETILHRNVILPIVRLNGLFQTSRIDKKGAADDRLNIVVVEFGTRQFGVVVEKLLVQQDIVIKQLTKELKGIKGFAGATILGSGSVALVLDVATLA